MTRPPLNVSRLRYFGAQALPFPNFTGSKVTHQQGRPGDEASATCSLPYLQHLSSTHTNRFPHICVVERNMLLLSEHHPVLPIYLSPQQLRCGIPAFWPQSSSSCCSTLSAWYALLLKLDFRNAFNTLTKGQNVGISEGSCPRVVQLHPCSLWRTLTFVLWPTHLTLS